ncbi:resolvase-like protein [Methylobacterium sp. B4]|nr:resolvase-like protein [Methylobacterium sp. B4]
MSPRFATQTQRGRPQMPSDLFVSYLHAGLAGSDRSGSPLAAQRAAVARYVRGRGRLAGEVVETGADRRDSEQPGLREALTLCRLRGATLLMAELGAFSEDPAFLRHLSAELRRLDLRFAAADSPEASELTLGIMAALAEAEDRLGVSRTPETMARRHEFYARVTAEWRAQPPAGKGGTPASMSTSMPAAGTARPAAAADHGSLAAPAQRSRERAEQVAPILSEIRAAGALTLEQVANALNALGVPSARGNRWYPMQVTRVEKRLAAGREAHVVEHALHA